MLRSVRLITDALERRELSARELVEEVYRRIDETAHLNVFISVADKDQVLRQAAAVDQARQEGRAVSPYAGVPLAVKDNIAVQGLRLTCGSRILDDHEPVYAATATERVLDHDILVVGKTNMDEFGFGSSTENSAFGPTRNPRAPDRVPGGTSGGSAAAVAAGIVPWALGTDTGGSVRQPASLCGVVGLRPTYGRVSRYGLVAYASSMDQIGPFANTVDDAAALFELIGGHDPRDSTTIPETPAPVRGGSRRARSVGIPREYLEGAQREVAAAVTRAADLLADAGWRVTEVSLPLTDLSLSAYYLISSVEAASNLARYDGVKYGYADKDAASWKDLVISSRTHGFGAEAKRRIMLGTYASSAGYTGRYYEQACRVRTLIRQEFIDALDATDVILSPVSPTTAWALGQRTADPMQMYLADVYSVPAALAGVPGVVVPFGTDDEDLPIGLQFTGPPLGEDIVFDAAYQLEALAGEG